MEKPPGEHPPVPVERDDVRVLTNRCPYCHDGVSSAEGVVCRECLARHHPGCWDEAGRCSSCSARDRLEAPSARAVPANEPSARRAYTECRSPRCTAPGRWDAGPLRLGGGVFPMCDRHANAARTHSILGPGFTGTLVGIAACSMGYGALQEPGTFIGLLTLAFGLVAALLLGLAVYAWQHRGLRRLK